MRVLALAHQYCPVRNAGAETMLHGMLRALARAGHDVHVSLSMQAGDPYEHDGVKVWPRAGFKANHAAHLPADVLISHLENSEVAAYLGDLNEIPVVLVHHNTFDIAKKVLHLPQARIDLVVVNSHWMRTDLEQWHRRNDLPMPRTVVIRPTVEHAEYETNPGDRVTLVNLRQLTDDVGAGILGKGSEVFWACAEKMPRTKFLGVTGAYGIQLGGDLPNVEVIDHVPANEMRDRVYARTRVLLVPSSYESWGRVATEATAAGIPVIASPTPGLVENLGPAGIFVDPDDIDGYVRELRRLAKPAAYAAARERALARALVHEAMRTADETAWLAEVERLGARVRI